MANFQRLQEAHAPYFSNFYQLVRPPLHPPPPHLPYHHPHHHPPSHPAIFGREFYNSNGVGGGGGGGGGGVVMSSNGINNGFIGNGGGYFPPPPRRPHSNPLAMDFNGHPQVVESQQPQPQTLSESKAKEGGVLIYIDNSNIWINTMDKSAERLGFLSDVNNKDKDKRIPDKRVRVSIRDLVKTALDGRFPIRVILYGSEPPAVGKFWNSLKGVLTEEPQVTKKSIYTRKEKEVDHNIMLDIGEDIVIHQSHASNGGSLILFTGDGGMISSVRKALKYNWCVEIWAYRDSMSHEYEDEQKKPENEGKIKIVYLDDHFENMVFYNLEFDKTRSRTLPTERCFVLTFKKTKGRFENEKEGMLTSIVNTSTTIVKIPMVGKYVMDKERYQSKYTHIALVCYVQKHILKEDSRRNDKTTDDHVGGKYDLTLKAWVDIENILGREISNDEKAKIEVVLNTPSKNRSQDSPYDFNNCVFEPFEQFLQKNGSKLTYQDATTGTQRALTNVTMRSLPQFRQEFGMDLDSFEKVEAPGRDDTEEGEFVTVSNEKPYRRYQLYSKPCPFKLQCIHRLKCHYEHDILDKEFWKYHSNNPVSFPKTKTCKYFLAGNCKYQVAPQFCPFSHVLDNNANEMPLLEAASIVQ